MLIIILKAAIATVLTIILTIIIVNITQPRKKANEKQIIKWLDELFK